MFKSGARMLKRSLTWPWSWQVLDRAVLRALQQPLGAEGMDRPKNEDHMILRYVTGAKEAVYISI